MKAGLIDGDRLLPLLLPLHAIANRYVAELSIGAPTIYMGHHESHHISNTNDIIPHAPV